MKLTSATKIETTSVSIYFPFIKDWRTFNRSLKLQLNLGVPVIACQWLASVMLRVLDVIFLSLPWLMTSLQRLFTLYQTHDWRRQLDISASSFSMNKNDESLVPVPNIPQNQSFALSFFWRRFYELCNVRTLSRVSQFSSTNFVYDKNFDWFVLRHDDANLSIIPWEDGKLCRTRRQSRRIIIIFSIEIGNWLFVVT